MYTSSIGRLARSGPRRLCRGRPRAPRGPAPESADNNTIANNITTKNDSSTNT